MCFAVTLFGLPSAASEEGFAQPVEQDPSSQTLQTDGTNPKENVQPKTDPHMLGFPNSVKALIEQYCTEYGHCPNEDSASYDNWPNHFFALRGWLTDLKSDRPDKKEMIEAAIKDLNDTYGGPFKVNNPEHLRTLPPPPKPYPLAKNSRMGLYDAIPQKSQPVQIYNVPRLKRPANENFRGTKKQLKHPASGSFFPRYYQRYDALPEEYR